MSKSERVENSVKNSMARVIDNSVRQEKNWFSDQKTWLELAMRKPSNLLKPVFHPLRNRITTLSYLPHTVLMTF